MLRSTDKMKYGGAIPFPVHDVSKTQPIFFYQLKGAFDIDAAYFRVHAVNNAVNEFSGTSFDTVYKAKQKYDAFYEQFLEGAYVINEAFKSNSHILEKIDNGTLLKEWRKFAKGHPQINAKLLKRRVPVDRDGIPV